ncbi:MAG: hypothetical protein ACOC33_02920 [bacterium]
MEKIEYIEIVKYELNINNIDSDLLPIIETDYENNVPPYSCAEYLKKINIFK